MRKFVKSLKDDIFYIGFPAKSLFNNIGDYKSAKTDYGFDIELPDDIVPDDDAFATWKMTVETQDSSKGDFFSLPLSGIDAEKEVLQRLRNFPLESKSMLDCAVFLSELRQLLNNT